MHFQVDTTSYKSNLKVMEKSQISRRTFLRGFGTALALPAFESFRPLMAATTKARAIGTTASGTPLRMAYLYIPNGVNLQHWRPDGTTEKYKMGTSFEAMEKHRADFQIFTGFEQQNARANGDGPGDHARGTAAFLTSARPRKTAGSDIQLGISADQVAANAIASSGLPAASPQIDTCRPAASASSRMRFRNRSAGAERMS